MSAQHTPAQAEAIEVADANLNNADLPLYSQVVEINAELLRAAVAALTIVNRDNPDGSIANDLRAAIAKAEGRS